MHADIDAESQYDYGFQNSGWHGTVSGLRPSRSKELGPTHSTRDDIERVVFEIYLPAIADDSGELNRDEEAHYTLVLSRPGDPHLD